MARRLLDSPIMERLATAMAATLLLTSSAFAEPGGLDATMDQAEPPIRLLDAKEAKCEKAGIICFAPATRTVAVEPEATAAPKAAKPVPPRFSRAAPLAAREGGSTEREGAWTVDLASTLKRQSYPGNVMFLFFDLADPQSLANREFTALYQISAKSQKTLAARLVLAPENGLRAGHTYRLRIVQLVGDKEVLLAEGDLTLL
jgi:hypothetical protein